MIAAGHICLDITPIFHNKKVERLNEILAPGKLINVKEADVSLMGKVGIDRIFLNNSGANHTFCAEDIQGRNWQKNVFPMWIFWFPAWKNSAICWIGNVSGNGRMGGKRG